MGVMLLYNVSINDDAINLFPYPHRYLKDSFDQPVLGYHLTTYHLQISPIMPESIPDIVSDHTPYP